MLRLVCISVVLSVAPLGAFADARLTQLIDLLRLDAYIDVLREEALTEFPDLADAYLGNAPDAVMLEQINQAYNTDRLQETVRQRMDAELSSDTIEAALIFVGSDTGQRIVSLELAARRAMSDPAIEDAAKSAWLQAGEEAPWLVARIHDIKDVSDLVDRNVTGALNSNFKFLQGLADGGGGQMAMQDALATLWAQEPAIREDTDTWLNAYLHLAYRPLSEADLEDYVAFWRTRAGVALNAAMFAAFDDVYDGVSYATARIIALHVGGEEL